MARHEEGQDISVRVGVTGGGSISGDSGKRIVHQLDNIVARINKNPLEISFKISEKSITKLQEDIQNALSNIDIGGSIGGGSSGGKSRTKRSTRTAKKDQDDQSGNTARILALTEVLNKARASISTATANARTKGTLTEPEVDRANELLSKYASISGRIKELKKEKLDEESFVVKRDSILNDIKVLETETKAFVESTKAYKEAAAAKEAKKKADKDAAEAAKAAAKAEKEAAKEAAKAEKEAAKEAAKAEKKPSKTDDDIRKDSIDAAKTKVEIDNIRAERKEIGKEISDLVKQSTDDDAGRLKNIDNLYGDLKLKTEELANMTRNGVADESTKSAYDSLIKKIREEIGALKDLQSQRRAKAEASAAEKTAEDANLTEGEKRIRLLRKMEKAISDITINQKKWTAARNGKSASDYSALGGYAKDIGKILASLKDGSMTVAEAENEFNKLMSSVAGANGRIKELGENTSSLGAKFKGLISRFLQWFSLSRIVTAAINQMKQMVRTVIEIDTAMTELRKVTDETDAAYNRFLSNATGRAKELGSTISDVVSATADFARLGYTMDEASVLADTAIVYKNVGDGIESIGEASESIISTMKAFGVEATDSMSVVDKFNEVSNHLPISAKGIGDSLMRSASSLSAAGNSIDQSIALVTAANSVVQNPDNVGRFVPNGIAICRKKVAISVKNQRWSRPSKDSIYWRMRRDCNTAHGNMGGSATPLLAG